MIPTPMETEDWDDDSWHRLVICEEDRLARDGALARPGAIGFRWFRSPNVVPIEQARGYRESGTARPGQCHTLNRGPGEYEAPGVETDARSVRLSGRQKIFL
jgi:hypothetical protein